MQRERGRTWPPHGIALLILAVAAGLLYAQVLDTGFWSPEDYYELNGIVQGPDALRSWSLFRPRLAGGYPVNPIFAVEYSFFGLDARPYYVLNLLVHILNAWIAYILIIRLLHNRRSALLAALLFALGVGSYGKNLMFASGISSLTYGTTCLLATLLFVLNEQSNRGRLFGPFIFAFYLVYLASLFMRGGTFSILATCIFYSFFFRSERGRPVLHKALWICLAIAAAAWVGRLVLGHQDIVAGVDPGVFLKNLPGYLILMVFPMQSSEMLDSASAVVRGLYVLAPFIRAFVGLSILSISIFGIVFGNRAVRFYIAWVYVMVLPFAVFRYPADWLSLRFLYLVSLGFCVLLTSAAVYGSRLLSNHRWRRFVPFALPALYLVGTVVLVTKLDGKNEKLAARLDLRPLAAQAEAARGPVLEP